MNSFIDTSQDTLTASVFICRSVQVVLRSAALAVLCALPACDQDPPVRPDTTPPAAILNLEATQNDTSSVYLEWTAPGDDGTRGQAFRYDVRVSPLPISDSSFDSATSVSAPTPAPAGQHEFLPVTGLQNGTQYFFAIKAKDETGNTAGISNIASVTTALDTIPPPRITDLAVSQTGVRMVSLQWTARGDKGGTQPAYRYDLRYSTAQLRSDNWDDATPASVPIPNVAGTRESTSVGSLEPVTTYYFAIRARDLRGNWSPLSNVAQTTTLPVPRTWTVTVDGSGDAPTIQAAIDLAASRDTVRVYPGTYFENLNFKGKDLWLVSAAGPSLTTINGSGKRLSVIQLRSGESSRAVVEGFTITGGVGASLLGPDIEPGNLGGGIFVQDASPTIRGNIIEGNGVEGATTQTLRGGGIWCGTRDAEGPFTVTIVGNTIRNNRTHANGGGIALTNGRVGCVMTDNRITDNHIASADGGGVWILTYGADIVIARNVIERNTAADHGGGVYIATSYEPLPLNIEFATNIVAFNIAYALERVVDSGGGLWLLRVTGRVHHNFFGSNRGDGADSTWGGGIAVSRLPTVDIDRNIIAFTVNGAAISCREGATPRITNNIHWMNGGGASGGACTAWPTIDGNMHVDPEFCSYGEVGYQLATDSPAFSHPAGPIGPWTEGSACARLPLPPRRH